MNEASLMRQLETEGFSNAYVWEDRPNAYYSDHTHSSETAHIILRGELILTMSGKSQIYREGDRCDVPANAVHSAQIGSAGCRYLIAER